MHRHRHDSGAGLALGRSQLLGQLINRAVLVTWRADAHTPRQPRLRLGALGQREQQQLQLLGIRGGSCCAQRGVPDGTLAARGPQRIDDVRAAEAHQAPGTEPKQLLRAVADLDDVALRVHHQAQPALVEGGVPAALVHGHHVVHAAQLLALPHAQLERQHLDAVVRLGHEAHRQAGAARVGRGQGGLRLAQVGVVQLCKGVRHDMVQSMSHAVGHDGVRGVAQHVCQLLGAVADAAALVRDQHVAAVRAGAAHVHDVERVVADAAVGHTDDHLLRLCVLVLEVQALDLKALVGGALAGVRHEALVVGLDHLEELVQPLVLHHQPAHVRAQQVLGLEAKPVGEHRVHAHQRARGHDPCLGHAHHWGDGLEHAHKHAVLADAADLGHGQVHGEHVSLFVQGNKLGGDTDDDGLLGGHVAAHVAVVVVGEG
mmetsp:Transcript_797/g.2157  ORF Transcript_797/g.2157 Transcript_797/m.2157 type:complete len:429 (-) Transcript_797:1046-2332(-)